MKLVETVESWDKLAPAQQQQYGKKDGIERKWNGMTWLAHTWNGWRSHEEEAYQMYKGWLKDFDVIGDASWSKWSYSSKKEEIVGTCHSIKSYNSPPPRKYPLLTGVSRPHSRFLSRELHIPVRTLWNPIDTDEFPYESLKTDRVLSLNRIMPQKGIHLLVQIAGVEGWATDIAGDDSTLVQDQQYVSFIKAECGKKKNFTYHGLVPQAKRLQLLKDAKVLVCLKDAGYEEVFGLSAVEAMACGTPVVALRTWGFEDIIETKSGFLCDNMEQVSGAIKKIMSGQVVFKPEEVRKSAERFNRPNIAKLYEKMLSSVKSGNRW